MVMPKQIQNVFGVEIDIKGKWCYIIPRSFKSPLLRCNGCCFALKKNKYNYECQLGQTCSLKEQYIYKEKI